MCLDRPERDAYTSRLVVFLRFPLIEIKAIVTARHIIYLKLAS
jgi:hypothetical protein